MTKLVAALLTWINIAAPHLAADAPPPIVSEIKPGLIQEMFCDECDLHLWAVYRPSGIALASINGVRFNALIREIIFIDGWINTETNVCGQSWLLHELIHHSQAISGVRNVRHFSANMEEAEAIGLQTKWLVEHGVTMKPGEMTASDLYQQTCESSK